MHAADRCGQMWLGKGKKRKHGPRLPQLAGGRKSEEAITLFPSRSLLPSPPFSDTRGRGGVGGSLFASPPTQKNKERRSPSSAWHKTHKRHSPTTSIREGGRTRGRRQAAHKETPPPASEPPRRHWSCPAPHVQSPKRRTFHPHQPACGTAPSCPPTASPLSLAFSLTFSIYPF